MRFGVAFLDVIYGGSGSDFGLHGGVSDDVIYGGGDAVFMVIRAMMPSMVGRAMIIIYRAVLATTRSMAVTAMM